MTIRVFRAFLAIILSIAVCQFGFVGRAEAGIGSTAHCWADIQDSAGNELASLGIGGVITDYTGLYPSNSSNEFDCEMKAGAAMSDYLKDHGHMCHVFFAANGGTVVAHAKEGANSWKDAGSATNGTQYGYPGSCFAPTGHVFPSYYIFTLIYAPPGCTAAPAGYDCGAKNSVEYASESKLSTTTSIEKTLESNTTLDAKYLLIAGSAGYDTTATDGSDIETSRTSSANLEWPDSGSISDDGIDHDFDIFYLLINPSVAVSGWHDPVTGQNHAQWMLGTKNGAPAVVRRVQVSQLRCALAGIGPRPGGGGNNGVNDGTNYDPTGSCQSNIYLQMTGQSASENASGPTGFLPGLTYDDYKQILSQDPFWNLAPNQHLVVPASFSGRYQWQPMNFDYSPPTGSNGDSCAEQTQDISNAETNTLSNAYEQDYKASMTLGGDMDVVEASLEQEMTWTSKVTHSHETENSTTATAHVGCPSHAWGGNGQGLYDVDVYYDNLYGTFLFGLADYTGRALVIGNVTDADGDPVPHQGLKVVVGSQTFYGFSRANGSFRILQGPSANINGTATLSAGAVSKAVDAGSSASVSLVLPTPAPSLSVTLSATPPVSPNGTLTAGQVSAVQAAKLVNGATATQQATTGNIEGTTAQDGGSKTSATMVSGKLSQAQAGAIMRNMGPQTKGPFYIAVKNTSPFARAKNVTVTAVQAISATGTGAAFGGTLPYAVPGGTAVLAGHTLVFTLPLAGDPAQQLSLLKVTVKADNLPPFTTTLVNVPVAANTSTQTRHQ